MMAYLQFRTMCYACTIADIADKITTTPRQKNNLHQIITDVLSNEW